MRQLEQSQVPNGMVANVPWGQPLDRWSDRMIIRGWQNAASESAYFPSLSATLYAEAERRGITEELYS